MAATMAGVPKPCVMSEKFVRWRWNAGSSTGTGRMALCGDLSWPSTSANSFSTCLHRHTQTHTHTRVNLFASLKSSFTTCPKSTASWKVGSRTKVAKLRQILSSSYVWAILHRFGSIVDSVLEIQPPSFLSRTKLKYDVSLRLHCRPWGFERRKF